MKNKLLILGGNALSCDIVNAAHELGVYTIVTDWNDPKDSPAKLISDEYWNISLMDYDKLLEKIKSEGVNGIITGFTDSYLIPYSHLCELAGLPCYATKEQFEQTLDKDLFKKMCLQYDVPVVPQYNLDTFDTAIISKENKVIIKPVDNSGSRGICICDDSSMFKECLETSLSFSQKKNVVVEKYMDCEDVSFEYLIQDGQVMLSSICDRYIYKTKSNGSVTSGLIYPSKYLDQYTKTVDAKVKAMFEGMGLKNGVLFMQAFVENGNFYFYEMGYRLSGGRHFIFTKNQNGVAAIDALINFAINGKMDAKPLSDKVNPKFKDICCQLGVLCKSERIYSIKGLDEIKQMSEVVDLFCKCSVGDTIGKEGTTAQIFAKIHIVTSDEQSLKKLLTEIKETIYVGNEKGENMVYDFFLS